MLNMLSACAQKSIEVSLKADESQHLNESSFIDFLKMLMVAKYYTYNTLTSMKSSI